MIRHAKETVSLIQSHRGESECVLAQKSTLAPAQRHRFFCILILSLVTSAFCSTPSRAAAYPWIKTSERDIEMIEDPRIEFAAQLELIRLAKKQIDIVVYDQRWDGQVAFPLLKALRESTKRGVQVRFLTSWMPQITMDTQQKAARYLTDPATHPPIPYFIFGGPNMKNDHWLWTDCVHEKLMIVDDRLVLHTGRGYSDIYLNWLDTAYLLKGELVTQSIDAFKALWAVVGSEVNPFNKEQSWAKTFKNPGKEFEKGPIGYTLTPKEQAEVQRLVRWSKTPAACTPKKCPEPIRARTLHHDLIQQLKTAAAKNPKQDYRDYNKRIAVVTDPVIEAAIELLADAKVVRFNTLSTLFHPKFKNALTQALSRGTSVEIFTNGKEAQKIVAVAPFPWAAGLGDMLDLLRKNAEIFTFDPKPYMPLQYLHRKVFLVGDTVIVGSHNFNLPSTVANDELSFEIESPKLAARLRKLQTETIHAYGQPTQISQIKTEYESLSMNFIRWISQPFMGLF